MSTTVEELQEEGLTTEQVRTHLHTSNCRSLTEKHSQHQQDLDHSFTDFKNAFDTAKHGGYGM